MMMLAGITSRRRNRIWGSPSGANPGQTPVGWATGPAHRPGRLRLSLGVLGLLAFGHVAVLQAAEPTRQVRDNMEEVWVTADAAPGDYLIKEGTTATKTDTPIIETPASIQIISRQVLEDQNALSLKDAYENVSGVQQAGNTLNAQSEVLPVIRGFESDTLMRNGLRATLSGAVDLINVERVEVLKGPAAVLYGALDPGGIINYVTKRPREKAFTRIEQQLGSFDHSRTSVDTTGSLNGENTLLYRLNAAYTNADSFRDEIELERSVVAPSLLWKPGERTEVLFDMSWLKEQQPYDTGVPLSADGEKLVPIETFFSDPDLAGRTIEDRFASYQLTHAFNSTWTLRHQLQLHRAEALNEALRPRSVTSDNQLRLRYQNEDRTDDEIQLVFDLTGTLDTGRVNHDVLLGLELIRQETDFRRFRQNAPSVAITADPQIDFIPPSDQPLSRRDAQTEWAGLYLQDQISLLDDRLKFLIGGRYDKARTEQVQDDIASPDVRDDAFSSRAAVLYRLTDNLSVYTSATQSFLPQRPGTVEQSGNSLEPETGLQYEAGLKGAMFDGNLMASLALYRLEKDDVAVFDLAYWQQTGELTYFPGVRQRSQGVEFDLSGALTEHLNVIASYAYTDSKTLDNESDPSAEGTRLGNVPLHTARLWLSYARETWGAGAGARYVSDNTAQFSDMPLDAYAVFDAGAWYRWQALTLRLNVDNLFDKEHYARASNNAIVHPGSPRTMVASVAWEF